jgi:hypothetical protein
MQIDLAVLVFDHVDGAEPAFANVVGRGAYVPWAEEMAPVERRRRGRILIRGTLRR